MQNIHKYEESVKKVFADIKLRDQQGEQREQCKILRGSIEGLLAK